MEVALLIKNKIENSAGMKHPCVIYKSVAEFHNTYTPLIDDGYIKYSLVLNGSGILVMKDDGCGAVPGFDIKNQKDVDGILAFFSDEEDEDEEVVDDGDKEDIAS